MKTRLQEEDDVALIERREYKYLVDGGTVAAIRACIRPFCDLDGHAETLPDHRYTVESLYLDTPDLSLYHANDHEQMDRVKIRVRGYVESPNAPVFFEVKRRINDVIAKTRGKVKRGDWAQLLEDDSSPMPEMTGGADRMAVERFLSLTRSMQVQPLAVVRYEREPWVSRVDEYARVTFDTRIQARSAQGYDFADSQAWCGLDDAVNTGPTDASMAVLELKFTNSVPRWMVNLVQSLGLVRRGFSKYGTSIKALYGKTEQRTPRVRGWF